jgi:tetratricopeptide (TPR) repeat protein
MTDRSQPATPTGSDEANVERTNVERARGFTSWRTPALVLTVVVGLSVSALLARWLEAHRPPVNVSEAAEELYVTPQSAQRMSLGFNGLVADWYWMRTLQYVGRKLVAHPDQLQLDDLSALGLKMLYPLMDATTTLDPQFMAAYEYGAVILPSIDDDAAVRLMQKGIEANPRAWRLQQYLGYIYWQRGQLREASAAYKAGSQNPDAPRWMETMAARMEAEGGDRNLAREIFRRMYDEAEDEQVKELALKRLAQLRSFDEREAIRRALADYQTRNARCPDDWPALAPLLRRSNAQLKLDAHGAPLDPADTPYVLVKDKCDVDLDPRSKVPYR